MKSRLISMVLFMYVSALAAMAQSYTIYYDNSATQWETVGIHYWSDPSTTWPGVEMEYVSGDIWSYTFPQDPSSLDGMLFKHGSLLGDNYQTADYKGYPIPGHLYKGAGGAKGEVTDEGVYTPEPTEQKAIVTATPKSGTRFSDEVTVTLTVNPVVDIHYTIDGTTPTTDSPVYTDPFTFTATTELRTLTVTAEGLENSQTFTYTKRTVIPVENNTLSTDYYRVNPDGKRGSNRTVNTQFTKYPNTNYQCRADNALSNWTNDDLICQGVARDIASAFKGKHEYPVIDSYAIYAAYDAENLYLGVQYVYSVWDEAGDGKSDNDRHRPWMMDGRLMLAFDLFADKDFEGLLNNGNTIWDDDGKYNVMNNGTDCIWLGNTKPMVGTPALFFPGTDGTVDYNDPTTCVVLGTEPYYGVADGLLPCIEHIWGQGEFGYDPEELRTNEGFVDLIDEVDRGKHCFYEWKFPLAKLGITEQHIKNNGIGVMVIDTYGQGAIGCTPYDPTVFDNASASYSKDPSTSAEKEDMDIFTFKHARIGGNDVDSVTHVTTTSDAPTEYFTIDGRRISKPSHGIYIVRKGSSASKVIM